MEDNVYRELKEIKQQVEVSNKFLYLILEELKLSNKRVLEGRLK